MNGRKSWSATGIESIQFSSALRFDNDIASHGHSGLEVCRQTMRRPVRASAATTAQRVRGAAQEILQGFNSRAFRREQPSDPHLMLEIISQAITTETPLPFILYWGKGPRGAIDQPDIECLDFLSTFMHRVQEGFPPGATATLIFSDTHAALNGHSASSIRGYFDDITVAARERGFASRWMSDVTRMAAPQLGPIEGDIEDIDQDFAVRLAGSAKKWYRGEGTAEDGARKYYRMSMLEKQAVEFAFPRSIFITYNSPDFRCICPTGLPVFYMYTLRRGYRVKPWFLPEPDPQ